MPKRANQKRALWIALVTIIIVVVLGYITSQLLHLNDTESAVELLRKYGAWVAIPFMILEVVIAPVPGGAMPIVLGALYGSALGALYGWVGNVGGSLIAFWLARRFGKKLLLRLFPNMRLDTFDYFIENRTVTIWIMYIIPIFPIDFMSFAMGVSKTTFKKFSFLVSIAYIPHILLLTFLGDYFTRGSVIQRVLIVTLILLILVIGYVIERRMNKKNKRVAGDGNV